MAWLVVFVLDDARHDDDIDFACRVVVVVVVAVVVVDVVPSGELESSKKGQLERWWSTRPTNTFDVAVVDDD